MPPLIQAARPQENCWTDELTLMKPPRLLDSTVAVIIAIAGTNRPDMQIIKTVEIATATTIGTRGRFVRAMMGIDAASDIRVNTRSFPARSAQRPIQFMLNRVQNPPVK